MLLLDAFAARQLQHQRDITLLARLRQPLREVGIADQVVFGIRIFQAVGNLTF